MNHSASADHRGPMLAGIAIYLLIGALLFGGGGILGGLLAGSCGIGFGHGCSTPTTSQNAGGLAFAIVGLVSAAIFVIAAWGLFRGKAWASMLALLPIVLLFLVSGLAMFLNLSANFGTTPVLNLVLVAWFVLNLFCIYRLWMNRSVNQALISA